MPEPSGSQAFDENGALYFADSLNHRIRRVVFTSPDFKRGEVVTIAAIGLAGDSGDGGPALDAEFDRSFGIGFDLNGDLYIAGTFNSRIRKVKR